MGDDKKTKEELIAELQELRSRLNDADSSGTRSQRKQLNAEIKFIGDFGMIQAEGVNFSETGICFEVQGKIPFEIEFEIDGELHERRANLVWMSRLEQARCKLGFEFIHPATTETSGLLWLYKELKDSNEAEAE